MERSDKLSLPNNDGYDWLYILHGENGEISFRANDFKMNLRGSPVLANSPQLDIIERGGFSFFRDREK